MGKIIVLISTTLDGFADAGHVIIDPDFFAFTQTLMAEAEVAAFGRNTFELFQDRWPQRLLDEQTPDWVRAMARSLHEIPKIVVSSTLTGTTWHNSRVINNLDLDYIRNFKKTPSGTMLTFGSLSLIESLTEMNVVDDYYFNIQPVISGKGDARLFSKLNLDTARPLRFAGCRPLPSGAHIIHYQNAGVVG